MFAQKPSRGMKAASSLSSKQEMRDGQGPGLCEAPVGHLHARAVSKASRARGKRSQELHGTERPSICIYLFTKLCLSAWNLTETVPTPTPRGKREAKPRAGGGRNDPLC